MTLEEAAAHWAAEINGWYGLNTSTEEVVDAFNNSYLDAKAYDGTSYVDMFFRDETRATRSGSTQQTEKDLPTVLKRREERICFQHTQISAVIF